MPLVKKFIADLKGPAGYNATGAAEDAAAIAAFINGTAGVNPVATSLAGLFVGLGTMGSSVKQFGAKGDGLNNDTAALNAAFQQRGIIVIPPGNYRATSTLIVPENTLVLAYGARIFRDGVFSFLSNIPTTDTTTAGYNGPSNITIMGGIWDSRGHIFNSAIANAFTWAHAKNIMQRDCTFMDVAGAHAVEYDGVDGGMTENCHFKGFFDTGGRSFSEAIQIDTATGGRGAPDNTLCRNITVTGGSIGASANLPAWPRGVGSHSCYVEDATHKFISISRVMFNGCTGKAVRGYAWDYVTIDKNFIDGGCAADAIEVSTPTPGGTGGAEAYMRDITITDNHIVNILDDGIYMNSEGAKNIQRVHIFGNIIDAPGNRGIYLLSTVQGAVIAGNTITAPGGAAITLNGCGGAAVYQNRARKTTTTSPALNILAGTTDTIHYLNDFRGYGVDAVNNAGTGTSNPVANFTA